MAALDHWLDPPPYFTGLHPDRPVEIHSRNLPHWRQQDATYFVTYRLSDSLPTETLDRFRDEKERWLIQNPLPHTKEQSLEFLRIFTTQIERWLDAGSGSCALKDPEASRMVSEAMTHFDGERYHLFASVVMGNHIHALIKPLPSFELDDIWASWQRFTATALRNQGVQLTPIWFPEGYDRIIRDLSHLRNVLRYIGNNPLKIGQTRESCHCHIHPAWKKAGWSFDSEETRK